MSEEKPRPEVCKGCYVATPNDLYTICTLEPDWNKQQCPCTICLVKAMCREAEGFCPDYDKFAQVQQPR